MSHYIAITGCPGTGKSTLLSILEETLTARCIYEKVDCNPYVPGFYAEKSRWAFPLSVFYLVDAIQVTQNFGEIVAGANVFCQDYEFSTHFEVYCRFLHSEGLLSEPDFEICSKLNDFLLRAYCVKPSLLIFLHAPISTLVERLSMRNRLGESGRFDEPYLRKLSNRFDEWLQNVRFPILKFDTSAVDFRLQTGRDGVLTSIRHALK